jgi:hypothetical protein
VTELDKLSSAARKLSTNVLKLSAMSIRAAEEGVFGGLKQGSLAETIGLQTRQPG